ncbi:phosphoglucose isomerase [Candidatus Campylobacter infans]|uniref:Glucose-6-phosphate isomerase n=1 Tax=Candidatus Campylobacter infans TaxID=2561898 RepID=A0A7H9CH91_9BACT|nr:glucose-6-phosphate isomerase [Candidatus Campylobacter infans]KAF0589802.1 MAG: phosphoglucose isomerase [Candidatus Campylobacter infans]QLI04608.1 phosphoglucose isomerase [Candidatus Campylobacter infans]
MVDNILHFKLAQSEHIASFARRMNDEKELVGYYDLPALSNGIIEQISKLKKSLPNFKNIALVGVGGSSLGVKAIYEMLAHGQKNLIFFDNLDPFLIASNLNKISLDDTIFIISSKSGTTIETISIFKCILERFKIVNFENFIIISDPNSPLEIYAKARNIRVFNIPKNVGGRFSVLSAVGLVPLGLSGVDVSEILNGAMACKAQHLGGDDDTILQKAYHYARHETAKINVLFSYSSRLASFNDWFVQLWAESLGKKRGYKRVGLTPVGLIGSKDQHSFLQLIMEGAKDKTVTFITAKKHEDQNLKLSNLSLDGLQSCDFTNDLEIASVLNAQARATMQALKSENISVDEIRLDSLDAWHSGYLVYYYELLTSATGLMLGINTYNQPGVELAKLLLRQNLEQNNF